MPAPRIPIENIYYLFCYAWNRFEEAKAIGVGGTESPDLPNLLAKVLLAGTHNLLRRGLDRGYETVVEDIGTVRGRINLNGSIRLRAQHAPRLSCEFDELNSDVLHNRVLKASLLRLARAPSMDRHLAHELRLTTYRLREVSDIQLRKADFRRVRLHRNNTYYDLVLKVSELAFDCLLPEPGGDALRFVDVLRDERKMAGVFESFVRNFYRAEQREFRVDSLQIAWDATAIRVSPEDRLPSMRTDIYLRNSARRLIIDTKYYAHALQTHHGVESFRSGNLYQMFAYLKNAAGLDRAFEGAEGMLLYPQVGRPLNARYRLQGHPLKIATIDLGRPWQQISFDLLQLLSSPT